MKLRTHDYLAQLGISYEQLSFPVTTEKGAANVARALGYQERLHPHSRECGDGSVPWRC